MRTTVELPPSLMRVAKARSAERGESLKTFLTRAVEAELGVMGAATGSNQRVRLPLFGRATTPLVEVSSVGLQRALADADAARLRTRNAQTSLRRHR